MANPLGQVAANNSEQVAKAGTILAGALFGLTWTDVSAIAQVFAGFGAFIAGFGTWRYYRSKRLREEADDLRRKIERRERNQ